MNPADRLTEQIQRDIDKVHFYLEGNLNSRIPLISEINRHILLGGGKRLRALLFVLSSRLCGNSGERAYYFSSIFEYLHAASLLHDDVIDNATIRRGKASANSLWGNPASVLVGDFLVAKSFSIAMETGNLSFLDVLSRTAIRMAEGMVLELIHSYDFDVKEEIYREILINKTAVLFSAACQTGAIWGGADIEDQEVLAQYGLELGIAFQIIDDLLDYTSTQNEFGKPVGHDFREGKNTLPLIHALTVCSEKDKSKLKEISKKDPFADEDFRFLFGLIKRHGGFEYTRGEALKSRDKAKGLLQKFSPTKDRQVLLDLADFVVERKS